MPEALPMRRIHTAEILAVGSELTSGETRDTNAVELARSLSLEGVAVRRVALLPDDLDLVTGTFVDALRTADLVVASGGLGPTPDDLTREAIAGALGETPAVDRVLERWLRALFRRRGIRLPEANLKQAWLIPSATAIPNPNGTAPGWWVDAPEGRLAVLLPGPPRELRPMWRDWVMRRLRERGLGVGRVVRTLRTYGIGESHVAELLGEDRLRAANPVVATYARADWLDVRVSAVDERDDDGSLRRPATEILEATVATIRETLSGHVLAEDETSWGDLVEAACERRAMELATVEAGTNGSLGALLAGVGSVARSVSYGGRLEPDVSTWPVEREALEVASVAGVPIGVALAAHSDGRQTAVRVAISGIDTAPRVLDLRLFQHGPQGRFRAAVAAAAFLLEVLDGRGGD
ncbi:MAG TPA: molybdopterin-binding protein [Candidatus Dormibacteraeota bacterium]|nr:molybdopterin-binding protein [Candidatus Dormibacteraeota bacterium]